MQIECHVENVECHVEYHAYLHWLIMSHVTIVINLKARLSTCHIEIVGDILIREKQRRER